MRDPTEEFANKLPNYKDNGCIQSHDAIASQEAQTWGADFVIEDHQLQGLGSLIEYPTSSQVENPPLTIGLCDIVSEQMMVIFMKLFSDRSCFIGFEFESLGAFT